jgi:hypothetical protein
MRLTFRYSLRFVVVVALAWFLATPLVRAQERINDKDLETLMRNLHEDAKSFRPVFTSALKKSTIRKTSQEKDAANLANRFEKQTEAMLNRFKATRKADNELSLVRSSADQLRQIVRSMNLGPQTNSRWDKIEAELQQISGAFGIQSSANDNPRGISPYGSGSDPNVSCNQAVGSERANKMVQDCLAVSTATRPPCNAQNACPLIIDEIKRGCSMLDVRNAPAFCNEYR